MTGGLWDKIPQYSLIDNRFDGINIAWEELKPRLKPNWLSEETNRNDSKHTLNTEKGKKYSLHIKRIFRPTVYANMVIRCSKMITTRRTRFIILTGGMYFICRPYFIHHDICPDFIEHECCILIWVTFCPVAKIDSIFLAPVSARPTRHANLVPDSRSARLARDWTDDYE